MALKAVVFPQDTSGYGGIDLYSLLGGTWNFDHSCGLVDQEENQIPENQIDNSVYGDWNSSPVTQQQDPSQLDNSTTTSARPKRRRSNSRKNKEEIENQRMTHIAVERNRRKQMNEYLSVLRSLMPHSYVHRGDQASIIGGAINFVKELERKLHSLGGLKEISEDRMAFTEFFSFPQYSTMGGNESANADIEVSMVDSHANLKIRSKRRPKQLLKIVSALQTMRLTVLHLNVTTLHQFILYSLSLKVEEESNLNTVDEIATAVYQMLSQIQLESMLN